MPRTRTLLTAALGLAAAATALVAPSTTAAAAPVASAVPAAAPSVSYTTHKDWAQAVFAQLNQERAGNGLSALRWSDKLYYSAHRHNLEMAKANTLSHQLSGEASLGDRVSVFYPSWSALGENIAWNSRRTQDGALALETSMVNETPPNDGHRRNILSTSYADVGVDVIDDSTHGRIWLTTDFARPR